MAIGDNFFNGVVFKTNSQTGFSKPLALGLVDFDYQILEGLTIDPFGILYVSGYFGAPPDYPGGVRRVNAST